MTSRSVSADASALARLRDIEPVRRDIGIFRIRSRMWQHALWCQARLVGTPLTDDDLWTTLEGISVGGYKIADQLHVWDLRKSFRRRMDAFGDIHTAVPLTGKPIEGIVLDAAEQIHNGCDPTEALFDMGEELVNAGYHWIVIDPNDKAKWSAAISELRSESDATRWVNLLADSYDEAF